jgi:hypothetical protein
MQEVQHFNKYGMLDFSAIKKELNTNFNEKITIVRLKNLPVFYISFTKFDKTISFAFDSKKISENEENSFHSFLTMLEFTRKL